MRSHRTLVWRTPILRTSLCLALCLLLWCPWKFITCSDKCDCYLMDTYISVMVSHGSIAHSHAYPQAYSTSTCYGCATFDIVTHIADLCLKRQTTTTLYLFVQNHSTAPHNPHQLRTESKYLDIRSDGREAPNHAPYRRLTRALLPTRFHEECRHTPRCLECRPGGNHAVAMHESWRGCRTMDYPLFLLYKIQLVSISLS